MKKTVSVLLLAGLLVIPAAALAQEYTAPNVNVITALNSVVNWAFSILLIVAAMFMIFGAFTYLTASGDADKMKTAHSAIMYSLVAVAVAVLARGLVTLVMLIVNKP